MHICLYRCVGQYKVLVVVYAVLLVVYKLSSGIFKIYLPVFVWDDVTTIVHIILATTWWISLIPRPSLPAFNVTCKKWEEGLVCNVTHCIHMSSFNERRRG